MKKNMRLTGKKLAEIKELKELFEEDFPGFKKLIEDHIKEFEKFSNKNKIWCKSFPSFSFNPSYIGG